MNRSRPIFIILLFAILLRAQTIETSVVNASPDMEWSNNFGGINHEHGFSVIQTNDGGYIQIGHTASFGAGFYDVYLIKTNAAGTETWSKTYG
jgi:hypothetical protein